MLTALARDNAGSSFALPPPPLQLKAVPHPPLRQERSRLSRTSVGPGKTRRLRDRSPRMDAEGMNRAGGRAGAAGGTQGRENNRARLKKKEKRCREDCDGKKWMKAQGSEAARGREAATNARTRCVRLSEGGDAQTRPRKRSQVSQAPCMHPGGLADPPAAGRGREGIKKRH